MPKMPHDRPQDKQERGTQYRSGTCDSFGLAIRLINWLYGSWLRMTYPFHRLGTKLSIHYTCRVKRPAAHRIQLGNHVTLRNGAQLCVGPDPNWEDPALVIEDDCFLHRRSQLDARNHIHLRPGVILGEDVLVVDHDQRDDARPACPPNMKLANGGRIDIGENSLIGHRAAIICLEGELILGRHCVVEANAVVTKSAPSFCVLSGNPARIVRHYDPARQAWVLEKSYVAELGPRE